MKVENNSIGLASKKHVPIFSVVVPVYNAEKYLKECIDSVLNQTFNQFEVILVDDGSSDKSGYICDEYERKDVRVRVIHKCNEGPTVARNTGVVESCGEYVVFLDSDDKLAIDLLERIRRIQIQYSPETIIFNSVHFGNRDQEEQKSKLEEGLYSGEALEIVHRSLILDDADNVAIYYAVWGKVFRREDYMAYQKGVPKELYLGEDLAVIAPLLAQCSSVYVYDYCGYYYRDTPGSIMNSFRTSEVEQIKILAGYLERVMGKYYESKIDSFVILHLFYYLERVRQKVNSYKEFKEYTYPMYDEQFVVRMKRAKSKSANIMIKVVFYLTQKRWFGILYLLRRIKQLVQ